MSERRPTAQEAADIVIWLRGGGDTPVERALRNTAATQIELLARSTYVEVLEFDLKSARDELEAADTRNAGLALALSYEREACAQIADGYDQGPGDGSEMGPVMAGQVAVAQSIAAAIRARPEPLAPPARRVRHKTRGSTYQVLGDAGVQISVSDSIVVDTIGLADGRILQEGAKLTVYRSEADGSLWVRFPDEFEDGRFEALP